MFTWWLQGVKAVIAKSFERIHTTTSTTQERWDRIVAWFSLI
jgi:hypothetical protein